MGKIAQAVKKVIDRGIGDEFWMMGIDDKKLQEVFCAGSEIRQDYVGMKIKMQDLMDTTVIDLDVDEIDMPEMAI